MLVSASARIHVTLLDTLGHTSRVPGGIGFAIELPATRVRILNSRRDQHAILGDLDDRDAADVVKLLGTLQEYSEQPLPRMICIERPPAHHGYGSKTALLSAIAFGVREFLRLPLSDDEIQLASRRGGTSGVGFHTFRAGGLVWDDGQVNDGGPIGPSSIKAPVSPPMLVSRWQAPPYGVLTIMPSVEPIAHLQEVASMASLSSYPRVELGELCVAVFKEFIPAFLNRDLATLRGAIDRISSLGFKRHELGLYGDHVATLREEISTTLKLPCGMSSFGPLLYILFDPLNTDIDDINRFLSARPDVRSFSYTRITNDGYSISG